MGERWYGSKWGVAERGVVQVSQTEEYLRGGIPLPILRLAGEEYERHHGQTFERVQERGGFSVSEVIMLLADALERVVLLPDPKEQQ